MRGPECVCIRAPVRSPASVRIVATPPLRLLPDWGSEKEKLSGDSSYLLLPSRFDEPIVSHPARS